MNKTISCNYRIGKTTINPTMQYTEKNIQLLEAKFTYVEFGEMILYTDDKTYYVQKGDMVLIPPMIKHTYTVLKKDKTVIHWFHFQLKVDNSDFSNNIDIEKYPFIVHADDEKFLKKMFKYLFEGKSFDDNSNFLKISIILRIVNYFFDLCPNCYKNTEKDNMDLIVDYITKNSTENFTLEELAKKSNYTKNHFIIKFKEKTGQTPINFLNNIRLENVRTMLYQTDLPINVIMTECGFMDFAYFSKLFKKTFGSSPKTFRQQMKTK